MPSTKQAKICGDKALREAESGGQPEGGSAGCRNGASAMAATGPIMAATGNLSRPLAVSLERLKGIAEGLRAVLSPNEREVLARLLSDGPRP